MEGVLVIGSVLVLLLVMVFDGTSLSLGCVGLGWRYSGVWRSAPGLYQPILTIVV